MDKLLYVAMSGAKQAFATQAVINHNVANASTTGFRTDLHAMASRPIWGAGFPTRVNPLLVGNEWDRSTGALQTTGRDLDVAIRGAGFIAVQGRDGTEAYTRNGHFEVSAAGEMQTSNGLPVLSSGGAPINVPAGSEVSIAHDGTISAKVGNQPASAIGRLKLATPTGDDPLLRGEDGLFRAESGDPMNNDETARVNVGALEGSNVNTIETMVGMIQTARQFETQMRLLQTAESNDRSAGQLLGLQG